MTALHQPQSTAVEEKRHQTWQTVHVIDHFLDFFFREHDRQSLRTLCANDSLDQSDVFPENFTIQKKNCVQRLVLSRGADMAVVRQTGEKPCNLRLAHFSRMALVMEENKPLNPPYIRLFGFAAVMSDADRLPDLIQ